MASTGADIDTSLFDGHGPPTYTPEQRPRRGLFQERCSQGAAVAVMRVKR